MTAPDLTFPAGFLWGASTSAHQVEGNNVASDWWAAENGPATMFTDRSGDACDSYHRWREDLEIVREVGLGAYRFSIEWARVVPARGHVSAAVLAHYRRMIEGCLERGLTPVVTLHHFTSPAWFRADGGWTAPGALADFRDYVRAALPILDGVEWVCTINEPNMVAIMEAVRAARARGEDTPWFVLPDQDVTRALVRAHGEAREVLSNVAAARSGWTIANQNVQAVDGGDERAAHVRHLVDDQFLDAAADDDFVGVQAYSRLLVGPDGPRRPSDDVRRTSIGWEFLPSALELAVRHTADRVGGVPILVTENGISTEDDDERIEYTSAALAGLASAVRDGIDVRGYLHWSLLDNFEWGSWAPRFGLVAVDRTTFVRTPKPSARWLGQVAAGATSVAAGAGAAL